MWACVSLPITGPWHTLWTVRVEKEATRFLWIKRESPGSDGQPVGLCVKEPKWMAPSTVGQAAPCGYPENTTVFVVCRTYPQRCFTKTSPSEESYYYLRYSKASYKSFFNRIGCLMYGYAFRGFATKAIDTKTVPLLSPLLSSPHFSPPHISPPHISPPNLSSYLLSTSLLSDLIS